MTILDLTEGQSSTTRVEPLGKRLIRDDADGFRRIGAEYQVLGGELGRPWRHHGTHADTGGKCLPPFDIPRQNQHDHIALPDSLGGKCACQFLEVALSSRKVS